jgi:hypothetical protein
VYGPLKAALLGILATTWPLAALAAGSPAQSAPTLERVGTPCAASKAAVLLDGDIHMDSIRFDFVPKRHALRTFGSNERGGYTIRRTNLPKNPKAGVTYRNVRLQLHLASTVVDPKSPRTRC